MTQQIPAGVPNLWHPLGLTHEEIVQFFSFPDPVQIRTSQNPIESPLAVIACGPTVKRPIQMEHRRKPKIQKSLTVFIVVHVLFRQSLNAEGLWPLRRASSELSIFPC